MLKSTFLEEFAVLDLNMTYQYDTSDFQHFFALQKFWAGVADIGMM